MVTKLEKIHTTALNRYDQVSTAEKNGRRKSVEDIRFAQVEGGQWDEDAIKSRRDRPRLTVNRIAGAIDQLSGDQRQARTDIKVRPLKGGATEDVAKVFTGLIRNIESQSNASEAYDDAFDETTNGGYGGWRVVTQESDDDFTEQEILILPIKGATTSLWFDTGAIRYDKRDANWAFLTRDITEEEHKERYPKSVANDWSSEMFDRSLCRGWFRDKVVRIAEYWRKIPVKRNLAKLSDGRIIDLDEEKAVIDELEAEGVTVIAQKTVDSHKIEMYVMDGSGILEGPKDWAGKFIPLIPMYGRQTFVEGVTHTRGIVRFAKDANRVYNYATSAAIETAALTPKDPIWITPTQLKGHEAKLRNFNVQNSPFMLYNPDPQSPGAPQRGGAPSVQPAFIQQIQQASMDLYHLTGMQPPSLGVNPELKSGKAIQAQERLGDRGSYVFNDNKEKSIKYTAEILIDLIPRIYDTERQELIMAQDGETELTPLNQTVFDKESQKDVIVNDLTLGKYGVVAETGPAFATQRQESAQQIIDLIATSPTFETLAMDLVAKDLPILESKELTKRVRKQMIAGGIIDPTDDEIKELGLDQPQEPDPQQEAITTNIEMQTEKLMSDIENQDADTTSKIMKAQQETINTYKTLMDAYKAQIEAGIPFTQDDHDIRVKQQDIIEEGQQQIDEGPNSEQAQSITTEQAALPAPQNSPDNPRRLTVEQPSASVGQDIVS